MTKTLAAAVVGALVGVSCTGSTGDPRVGTGLEASVGEIVDVASVTDIELVVLVRTDEGTLPLFVGHTTHLSVGGVPAGRANLRDYVGYSAVVVYQEQRAGRREAWFIGVEPRRGRRSASQGLAPRTGHASSQPRRRRSG